MKKDNACERRFTIITCHIIMMYGAYLLPDHRYLAFFSSGLHCLTDVHEKCVNAEQMLFDWHTPNRAAYPTKPLANPQASLEELCQSAQIYEVQISLQGLQEGLNWWEQ